LIPAAQRVGARETRWPGYVFVPEAQDSFLFCQDGSLVRVDDQGRTRSRADLLVHCSSATRMIPIRDQVLVLNATDISVLDRDLRLRWHRSAPHIAVSNGSVFLVQPRTTDERSPLLLESLDFATGSAEWTAQLDG